MTVSNILHRSLFLILGLFILVFSTNMLNAQMKTSSSSNVFLEEKVLYPLFEKLYQLELGSTNKINIVHIGDSHIQADFLTNEIRKNLQSKFGNGGYGFTFPYRLVKTNGTDIVKYTSDASWNSRLNIFPVKDNVDIGLSGIGFYTDNEKFSLELNVTPEYAFNTLKIIYSTDNPQYQIANANKVKSRSPNIDMNKPSYFVHTIQRGEYLSLLAQKFNTTVNDIKKLNGITDDVIQAGRDIKIPIKDLFGDDISFQTTNDDGKNQEDTEFVNFESFPYYSVYKSNKLINNILIYSKDGFSKHNIDGFVIENDKPGVIYHSIGVNGARISDFNKYPLFFKQLKILKPDLIIVSFGTNESYQNLSVNRFVNNMRLMCDKIQADNPGAVILVITAPPSLVPPKKEGNPLVEKYSSALVNSNYKDIAVWDLYNKMDGEKGIREDGKYVHLISKDKVHYTLSGYRVQGQMFSTDFIKAYNNFKSRK